MQLLLAREKPLILPVARQIQRVIAAFAPIRNDKLFRSVLILIASPINPAVIERVFHSRKSLQELDCCSELILPE